MSALWHFKIANRRRINNGLRDAPPSVRAIDSMRWIDRSDPGRTCAGDRIASASAWTGNSFTVVGSSCSRYRRDCVSCGYNVNGKTTSQYTGLSRRKRSAEFIGNVYSKINHFVYKYSKKNCVFDLTIVELLKISVINLNISFLTSLSPPSCYLLNEKNKTKMKPL